MNSHETAWRPSDRIRKMIYSDSISPAELRDAIVECWHSLFGKDPIYNQMLRAQFKKEGIDSENPDKESLLRMIINLERIMGDFKTQDTVRKAVSKLNVLSQKCTNVDLSKKLFKIVEEGDIVRARNQGLSLATAMGFGRTDCVKIATAISELARNIIKYAESGTVEVIPLKGTNGFGRPGIKIIASDNGPGIMDVESVLNGSHVSKDGLGIGLSGTKRLTDEFSVETDKGNGTTVVAVKYL